MLYRIKVALQALIVELTAAGLSGIYTLFPFNLLMRTVAVAKVGIFFNSTNEMS